MAAVQRGLAFVVVLIAVAYLAGRAWRQWRSASAARRSPGCGPGCGCA
jgi:hypothetical protein